MKKWQMEAVLKQAEITLKGRGYENFEQREESTEFSSPLTYLVAKKASGEKAEAYPRQTRSGVTYVIYED